MSQISRIISNLDGCQAAGDIHADRVASTLTPPVIVDNYEWLGKMSLFDFLKNAGRFARVNSMINRSR